MKRGVSLIILVITIVVLAIFAGVAAVGMSSVLTTADESKLQMDIAQLESLMNTYKIRKSGVLPFDTVEFNVAGFRDSELEQFYGETVIDNKIKLYVIDLYEIDAKQVNFGNLRLGAADRYLYSNVTGKVYYELGLEIDGKIYFYVKNGDE